MSCYNEKDLGNTTNTLSLSRKHIQVFDSLRGFAIFGIFVSHFAFLAGSMWDIPYKLLSYARFGVDFFFILSGFVLALGYSKKFNGKITFEQYITFEVKRLKKIYPIYLVVIIIGIVRWAYLKKLSTIGEWISRIIASAFLLQSAVPIDGFANSFGGATWFLSCIFVLYLVAPFLFLINNKIIGKIKVIIISMVVTFGIFGVVYVVFQMLQYRIFPEANLGLVYSTPYINIFAFVIGILCYDLFDYIRLNKPVTNTTFIEFIIAVVAIVWALLSGIITGIWPDVINYEINMLLSSAIVVVFAFERGLCSRLLCAKLFIWFGKISFEFYLIHYMVINIGYDVLSPYLGSSDMTLLLYVVIFSVISVALAYLSNRLINYIYKRIDNRKSKLDNVT